MTTTTEETQEMAPSIDDYAAEQDAMNRMRARHVTAAFTEAAQGWTPGQVSSLVNDLDLSRYVTADGDVDKAKVQQLLSALDGKVKKAAARGNGADLWEKQHGHKPSTVADVMATRRAARGGQ